MCLRRLAAGSRAAEVRFGRFLANPKVTVERLIEGWSRQTGAAVAGRHVLAIQDTSEIHFSTRPRRRRGLGEVGKGNAHGVLAHVMAAVDADNGSCLGLVTGSVYNRQGRVRIAHAKRALKDKESKRWEQTAQAAKPILAAATMVTSVSDREGDIYGEWASVPETNFHLLTRMMHDRGVAGGGTASQAIADWPFAARRGVELLATPGREARNAVLSLRFGEITIRRPKGKGLGHLPKTVTLRLVEVVERDPPANVEPVCWRLLTTHAVDNAATAWQIVDWYRRRWIIEQLFRLMKAQGLRTRGQSTRHRRRADEVDGDRRPGGLRRPAVGAGARRRPRTRRQRLRATRDRGSRPTERDDRGQDGATEEPARPSQLGMGELDHRSPGWLERLSLLEAARPNHHAQRLGILPSRCKRMDTERCVHTVARARGEGRGEGLGDWPRRYGSSPGPSP